MTTVAVVPVMTVAVAIMMMAEAMGVDGFARNISEEGYDCLCPFVGTGVYAYAGACKEVQYKQETAQYVSA